jgi:hypothetical protein
MGKETPNAGGKKANKWHLVHHATYGSLQASNLLTNASFSGFNGIDSKGVLQFSASQVVETRTVEEVMTNINGKLYQHN